MQIETIVVGPLEVNCYVAHEPSGGAIVIDPGGDAEAIMRLLADRELTVAAYALTHGHMDHISALAELHGSHPAPVGMHAQDLNWAFEETNQMPPFYGVPGRPSDVERIYAGGQTWEDAAMRYTVMSTPGHSPGSVCLHFPDEGVLFAGDTLFAGSVGRTDLPGGNSRLLTTSLGVLARLPEETVVYPGHGPRTTIGQEKRTNFFMRTPLSSD